MKKQVEHVFPILETLPKRELHIKTFQPNTLLFHEGDDGGGIPFILNGIVQVLKTGKKGKELVLYRIHPGETCVLSITSALSNSKYPATAIAEEDVEAVIIPNQVFKDTMNKNERLRQFVFQLIMDKFQETLLLFDELFFQKIDERLIKFLLSQTNQDGEIIYSTHDQVAVELGTAREVISRNLKELEKEGLIYQLRGKIMIVNRYKLEQKLSNC